MGKDVLGTFMAQPEKISFQVDFFAQYGFPSGHIKNQALPL